MSTWRIIDYSDVWGNPEDGYEVNNSTIVKENVEISNDATDKQIVQLLNDIDYFICNDLRVLKVEDNVDWIEVYRKKDMYPLCRLEREYD